MICISRSMHRTVHVITTIAQMSLSKAWKSTAMTSFIGDVLLRVCLQNHLRIYSKTIPHVITSNNISLWRFFLRDSCNLMYMCISHTVEEHRWCKRVYCVYTANLFSPNTKLPSYEITLHPYYYCHSLINILIFHCNTKNPPSTRKLH